MSEPAQDLWGDLSAPLPSEADTPWRPLLREQAELLADKTNGALTAELAFFAAPGGVFRTQFIIVVPALDHYSHELFEVTQRQFDPFPVEVTQRERHMTCRTVDDFVEALRAVLGSTTTREVVNRLWLLAREQRAVSL